MIHRNNKLKILLKNNNLILVGATIITAFLIMAVFAPYIAPHDPLKVDVEKKLLSPCIKYPLGTDQMGRCILSRIIFGTRTSMLSSFVVMIGILVVGIPLGLIAGYYGGIIDTFIMRLSDVASTFPSSLVALAVVGIKGAGIKNIMIVFVALWWAPFARIIRGLVVQLKEKDFVTAAVACGSSKIKIITKHIMLNAVSPIIVLSTLRIAAIIMHLASFSFIGLGTQQPTPDWGVMLNDSRQYLTTKPLLMLWPGLAIMLVVFGLNMLGEGLNDALMPANNEVLYENMEDDS